MDRMLKVDRAQKRLVALNEKSLRDVALTERGDVQRMVRQSSDAFFMEMGEKLLLVGEEVRPAEFVEDRIDLLAVDPSGAAVVIELKRDQHKLQLLQALSYAAMVSQWEGRRLIEERAGLAGTSEDEAEEEVEQFLEEELETLNVAQRVILIAEGFEFEVLVTAEWLNEKFGVDVRCYRLALSADGRDEFLTCTCIYPPPELTAHARRRGRGAVKPIRYADWKDALEEMGNRELAAFFEKELAAGQESYLRRRGLRYRIDGKRRLHVFGRRKVAYVWQSGRFERDVEFWKERIGEHAEVEEVRNGRALRFYLRTAEDCRRFAEAAHKGLDGMKFTEDGAEGPDEE